MKKVLLLLSLIIILGAYPFACNAESDIVGISVEFPQNIVARKCTVKSIKLKWEKVKNVDGYLIYRYDKKTKKYKRIKTIKGNNHTEYVDKKLKTNKIYRYKLAAYKKVGNKTYKSPKSDWVSAKTYKKKTKYINAGKIKGTTKLVLGLMGKDKIKLNVKPSKYGVHIMKYPISTELRWESSNTNIATVDNKGNVKASKVVGTCYIYAMAHNGNTKRIKIEVKDYTKSEFDLYDGNIPVVNEMLTNYKEEVCSITKYLLCNYEDVEVYVYQNSADTYSVSKESIDVTPIDTQLKKLLFKFPTDIEIIKENRKIEFIVRYYDGTGNYDALIYMIDNDGLNKSLIDTAVASHWQAISFRPH